MAIDDFSHLNHIDTPLFVLKVDEEGIPIYAAFNESACKAAGRREEDVLGKTAKELYPGRLGQVAFKRHMHVVSTRKKLVYQLMLPLNDRVRSIQTTLSPVLDEDGEILYLIGTSIDRTAEQETMELRSNMHAVGSEIEDFISLAAHDLKAPMRNIQQIADLLREDFEDHGDGKLELIELLEQVALKATDLMQDLLSHAQATSAIRQDDTFDLAQLCAEIFVILDPLGNHSLKAEPCLITTDKTAVQIALRNLFDNAIKHSGKEFVKLNVTVDTDIEDRLRMSVQDNGLGFAESTVSFLDGGKLDVDSGFGLLGVRRLIQARGGSLSAQNLPDGQGSVVRFSIPGTYAESSAA